MKKSFLFASILIISQSLVYATSQKITVYNKINMNKIQEAALDIGSWVGTGGSNQSFKIMQRRKHNGIWTPWKMKKAINGHQYLKPGKSEEYSMNLSKNAEYKITSGNPKFNGGNNDAASNSYGIKHKGSSFKGKHSWTIISRNESTLE